MRFVTATTALLLGHVVASPLSVHVNDDHEIHGHGRGLELEVDRSLPKAAPAFDGDAPAIHLHLHKGKKKTKTISSPAPTRTVTSQTTTVIVATDAQRSPSLPDHVSSQTQYDSNNIVSSKTRYDNANGETPTAAPDAEEDVATTWGTSWGTTWGTTVGTSWGTSWGTTWGTTYSDSNGYYPTGGVGPDVGPDAGPGVAAAVDHNEDHDGEDENEDEDTEASSSENPQSPQPDSTPPAPPEPTKFNGNTIVARANPRDHLPGSERPPFYTPGQYYLWPYPSAADWVSTPAPQYPICFNRRHWMVQPPYMDNPVGYPPDQVIGLGLGPCPVETGIPEREIDGNTEEEGEQGEQGEEKEQGEKSDVDAAFNSILHAAPGPVIPEAMPPTKAKRSPPEVAKQAAAGDGNACLRDQARNYNCYFHGEDDGDRHDRSRNGESLDGSEGHDRVSQGNRNRKANPKAKLEAKLHPRSEPADMPWCKKSKKKKTKKNNKVPNFYNDKYPIIRKAGKDAETRPYGPGYEAIKWSDWKKDTAFVSKFIISVIMRDKRTVPEMCTDEPIVCICFTFPHKCRWREAKDDGPEPGRTEIYLFEKVQIENLYDSMQQTRAFADLVRRRARGIGGAQEPTVDDVVLNADEEAAALVRGVEEKALAIVKRGERGRVEGGSGGSGDRLDPVQGLRGGLSVLGELRARHDVDANANANANANVSSPTNEEKEKKKEVKKEKKKGTKKEKKKGTKKEKTRLLDILSDAIARYLPFRSRPHPPPHADIDSEADRRTPRGKGKEGILPDSAEQSPSLPREKQNTTGLLPPDEIGLLFKLVYDPPPPEYRQPGVARLSVGGGKGEAHRESRTPAAAPPIHEEAEDFLKRNGLMHVLTDAGRDYGGGADSSLGGRSARDAMEAHNTILDRQQQQQRQWQGAASHELADILDHGSRQSQTHGGAGARPRDPREGLGVKDPREGLPGHVKRAVAGESGDDDDDNDDVAGAQDGTAPLTLPGRSRNATSDVGVSGNDTSKKLVGSPDTSNNGTTHDGAAKNQTLQGGEPGYYQNGTEPSVLGGPAANHTVAGTNETQPQPRIQDEADNGGDSVPAAVPLPSSVSVSGAAGWRDARSPCLQKTAVALGAVLIAGFMC